MNRRGLFRQLLGAALAPIAAKLAPPRRDLGPWDNIPDWKLPKEIEGLSIRLIRGYDITQQRLISRLDAGYAWLHAREDWGNPRMQVRFDPARLPA